MAGEQSKPPARDRNVSWFTALLASLWLIGAWRLQGHFIDLMLIADRMKAQDAARVPPVPANGELALEMSHKIPSFDSFATHFFTIEQWPTIVVATIVLAKDPFLPGNARKKWNWILAAVASVLLVRGWLDAGKYQTELGIIF